MREWAGKELGDAEEAVSAEQIVLLLRQIEVLMSQGKAAPLACREAGISQQSFVTSARLQA